MEWTAWDNGSWAASGAGYGFKIPVADRDQHFERSWGTVVLELPSHVGFQNVEVNIDKDSFWNGTCRELIHRTIGQWLIERGLAPWPLGAPPSIVVERIGVRRFRIVAREGRTP